MNAKASLTSYRKHAKRFRLDMGVEFTFFSAQRSPLRAPQNTHFLALQLFNCFFVSSSRHFKEVQGNCGSQLLSKLHFSENLQSNLQSKFSFHKIVLSKYSSCISIMYLQYRSYIKNELILIYDYKSLKRHFF